MPRTSIERARGDPAQRARADLLGLGGLYLVCVVLAVGFDLFEWMHGVSRAYEEWELDEVFSALMLGAVFVLVFAIRRVSDLVERDREAHLLLRAVEQLPVSVALADAEGRLRYVNPAFTAITGYSRAEVRGLSGQDLAARIQDPAASKELRDAMLAGEVWRGELDSLRKDGTPYVEELTVSPVSGRQGGVPHFISVGRDVTEQRRQEEFIEFAQAALNNSADMVLWINRAGTVRYANESALRGLGYTAGEIAEVAVWDFASDPPERWPRNWAEVRRKGSVRFDEEPIRRKDGSVFLSDTIVTYMTIGDEEYQCGIVRDVTERVEAERALRASEERFRRVVDHISEALIQDDAEGRIVFANRRFADLIGCDPEEALQLTLEDYVAPEWRSVLRDRHDRRVRGEPVEGHFEYEGLTADGERRWIEVDVVPLTDAAGDIFGTQSALRDITDRKRAERELKEATLLLLEAQRVARLGSYRFDIGTGTWSGSEVLGEVFGVDEATPPRARQVVLPRRRATGGDGGDDPGRHRAKEGGGEAPEERGDAQGHRVEYSRPGIPGASGLDRSDPRWREGARGLHGGRDQLDGRGLADGGSPRGSPGGGARGGPPATAGGEHRSDVSRHREGRRGAMGRGSQVVGLLRGGRLRGDPRNRPRHHRAQNA